ncbi:gamma-tubulin complex component 3 homolog isoform X3 [Hydra vulgaris]|uniref:Gamma-tubulin complex component 3 homolog isoform X3 n=1 Tax=Hydra vulgaris TaxID=6087 RepID=A0ABM4B5Q8_HYDVU
MASSKATIDVNSPSNLLFVLCKQVLRQNTQGLTDELISSQYQYALRLLGSRFSSSIVEDEFQLAECIKRNFAKQGKVKEAAQFSELYSKLKGQQDTIKNRWGVLYLLYTLSKDGKKKNQNVYFGGSFDSFASTLASSRSIPKSSSSSGLGSTFNSSIDPTPDMSSFLPKGLSAKNEATNVGINFRSRITVSKDRDTSDIAAMVSKSQLLNRMSQVIENSHNKDYSHVEQEIPKSDEPNTLLSKIYASNSDGTLYEVTESFLLRDIFYVFQGIEGKLIKYDAGIDSYKISNDVGIPLPVRDIICKLAELGWLFRRVRKYLDARTSDKALGLVGQSFCAAIEKEIIEYYRLIAVLEAQLNQEDSLSLSNGDHLTLRRLVVWTHDPLLRMKALTTLVDQCKGKKGGNLLSAIFSHTQVGDPFISKLVSHILYVVSHPIRSMLERWIFEGDLQDSYNEFFVAADPAVRNERLWHEKYSIRKQMLPSFITDELATKILNIGKSINFIRVVCEDRSPIFGHSDLQNPNAGNSESLHVDELNSSALQDFIDLVYENTSKHLLDVLFNKYKFLDHLQAMRRYLLLGQGDFIRHLMDLLEPDLMRPANSLYMHNLTGLLETAIRATNAQFDDQDILKRLDCRLLEISPGDCGWDVYSLDYNVDGPISTVFTPDVILQYLRIFNFLWRAKRMEYCLTGIWKNQMSNSRILYKLPEMVPLLHLSHCLEAVMVHFINQMQYFITFEVLECSWEELLVEIKGAKDLDHVINAHDAFLQQVTTRALMDNESRAMLTQLRAIFDLIIQFQTTQEAMYTAALTELGAREEFEKRIQQKTSDGKWGITDEESAADKRRVAEFTKTFIPSTRAQIRVLHQSYQDMLQDFLVMLNSHSDVSLRFLCFRLDFNEHYKKLEPKLRSPTKYGTIKGKGLYTETTKL